MSPSRRLGEEFQSLNTNKNKLTFGAKLCIAGAGFAATLLVCCTAAAATAEARCAVGGTIPYGTPAGLWPPANCPPPPPPVYSVPHCCCCCCCCCCCGAYPPPYCCGACCCCCCCCCRPPAPCPPVGLSFDAEFLKTMQQICNEYNILKME